MKKHSNHLIKALLSSLAIGSMMVSCGLTLTNCTNSDNDNNSTGNKDIKIEGQSSENNEVTSGNGLTLYINISSSKPVEYKWFVNKNNSNWDLIKDADESSYSITSDLTQNINVETTWKYRVDICDADNSNNILVSRTYNVNIKPNQTTPNPEPSPKPEPSPNPSPPNPSPIPPSPNPNLPPSKPNNPTTSITSSSITLKNIGQLLPSQYLSDINSLNLKLDLIIESFDKNIITETTYKVDKLDDLNGTLSVLMNYKENGNTKLYTFNFNNLLNLETNGGNYNLEFDGGTNILNLSAQEIYENKINSKNDFKKFVNDLEKSNIKFKFKNKGNELSITYLSFDSVQITGFDTTWFTTNKKLTLSFTFKNLKINYYVKDSNTNINSKSFNYPTNLKKIANMSFYSAVDYLLNKITNNPKYSSNKYSDWYYYDIKFNNSLKSQIEIADNKWLSNVLNKLTYNNKNYVYRPVISKNDIIDCSNGSLTIGIKMLEESNVKSTNYSQETKIITISGFSTYDINNLFSNSNSVDGKFSLSCQVTKYDDNIKKLKTNSVKNKIINKIDNMNNLENLTFTNDDIPITIIKNLINSLTCNFSGIELEKEICENETYYLNNLTAIENFYINPNSTLLKYDKKNDVFQLKISDFSINIGSTSNDYTTNNNDMIINITSPGNSLSKLRSGL